MSAIDIKYQKLGGKGGLLGPASGGEKPVTGGRIRYFKNGVICWTKKCGAVQIHGALAERWKEMGADKSTLGLPATDQKSRGGISRAKFTRGVLSYRTIDCQLYFMQQNMALLPDFESGLLPLYKGKERKKAIERLEEFITREKPEVIGLSETFVNDDRRRIAQTFFDAHQLDGSNPRRYCLSGPDENDFEEDGGLLLLSKYPCMASHSTIYRDTAGWDALSNKGALHMRIRVPNHPTDYDIFHSHIQNPNESGKKEAYRGVVEKQFVQLSTFIQSHSNMKRPALLMGDLNTDGLTKSVYKNMINILGKPDDLWKKNGDGSNGITSDSSKSFTGVRRSVNSNERHRKGTRIDYFLSFKDKAFRPLYDTTELLVLQSSSGRDMSDHYGLATRQNGLRIFETTLSGKIRRVRVALVGFSCIEETDEVGNDEVYFNLGLKALGRQWKSVKTGVTKNVSTGKKYSFKKPKAVTCDGPIRGLSIQVTGREEDDWPNTDDVIGHSQIVMQQKEIQELIGSSKFITMPMLKGDGGEYAVRIKVEVG